MFKSSTCWFRGEPEMGSAFALPGRLLLLLWFALFFLILIIFFLWSSGIISLSRWNLLLLWLLLLLLSVSPTPPPSPTQPLIIPQLDYADLPEHQDSDFLEFWIHINFHEINEQNTYLATFLWSFILEEKKWQGSCKAIIVKFTVPKASGLRN